ncbi:MAG: EamA family transporter [Saprospiraceae bacterium]|nr:EamA family transporter [Saprospiraceae bacterium]
MNKRSHTAASTDTSEDSPDLRSWLVLLLLSLIWGTSFILIKRGLEVYQPVQVACLRISISALAFLPILLYNLRKVDWTKWKALLLVGLTGSAVPAFLFAVAQTEVSSSIAGILNSLSPLFTLVLGVMFFGSRLVWKKVLGVFIGLLGAVMLILFGKSAGLEGNLWYGLLVIVATLCYATSVNVVGTFLKQTSSLLISASAFVMVGPPAILLLLSSNFTDLLLYEEGAWEALGYIAILALASTVLASVIFFMLVKWTSPLFSSTVAYLVPVVALGWGAVDGEPITLLHGLGMALILSGVYLTRHSGKSL